MMMNDVDDDGDDDAAQCISRSTQNLVILMYNDVCDIDDHCRHDEDQHDDDENDDDVDDYDDDDDDDDDGDGDGDDNDDDDDGFGPIEVLASVLRQVLLLWGSISIKFVSMFCLAYVVYI